MALTIETGAIVSGADSYVSLVECDAYHTARGNASWAGTDTVKEQALRKACSYIDHRYARRWKGIRTSPTQPLKWPRQRVVQYEEEPTILPINFIPQELKDAQCECALRYLSSDMLPDLENGGRVKSVTVGSISQTFMDGASANTSYQYVNAILSTLITGGRSLCRS